jgi:NADH-quinone oxidoreductase subunit G
MTNEEITYINLTIDGKPVRVPKGTTVYTAAKEMGIELPIFCYQDRMPPLGACRVCMVEVEKMAKPQTSCTLEATEGMVVKTQSSMAVKGREEILEFLLINHPLDCPICDKGGECPLQDQTMKFGPGKSRFYEDKRRFKKPLPLGPVLMLDRERCVTCARCTRFGEIVAGDHALELLDRGYKTEVGTPDGGPADSKYIGNTIMICPVGALTSRVYRFRARPWDNTPTVSTCTLCPVGCSMILDSRSGEIDRILSHENRDVNDIWLCDKGWFGYEFSSSKERLTTPLIRRDGKLTPASWEEAFSFISAKIKDAMPKGRIAALGGNTLTCEENYLFQKLMREAIGSPHLDHRIGQPITDGLQNGMEISIGECENLGFAIILGADLTEEFPVIWLRLRQAINKGAKVLFLGHFAPEIVRYFEKSILHAPGEEIETLKKHMPDIQALIATGQQGAFFVGRQYVANTDQGKILTELAKLQSPKLSLNFLTGDENSLGAQFAGMHPNFKPQEIKTDKPGMSFPQIIDAITKTGWDYLHIAGADVAKKLPNQLWNEVREKLGFLVVQDIFFTKTCELADVVLPTLSFVEKDGSFINIERRVQKLKIGKIIPENILSDAEIFINIALKLNFDLTIEASFLEKLQPGRLSTQVLRPQVAAQVADAKKPLSKNTLLATFSKILFDKGVRMKHNTHLVQLCKEPTVRIHPTTAQSMDIKDGQKVQLKAHAKTVTAKVKLETGIAENTVVLPIGFDELPVYELGINLLNGLHVEIYGI